MRKVIGLGETVLDIIFKDNNVIGAVPGGSVFNSLVSLGRCGIETTFISVVGNDNAGEVIVDFMKDNGMSTGGITHSNDIQTPVTLAFLNENNDAQYSFYRVGSVTDDDANLPAINADDIVIIGSYFSIDNNKHSLIQTVIEAAKNNGAIVYYDVNFRLSHKNDKVKLMSNIIENLEAADIVRGSNEDFSILYNIEEPEKVYKSEISFYCKNFLYTNGSKPMTVFGGEGFKADYETESINPVSTIGAGDSFNAGIIYGLISNGITREQLICGLTEEQWNKIVPTALTFSVDCCMSLYNYVSKEFGIELTNKSK